MARRILEGDALARFDSKATELGNETNANFATCLDAVTSYTFPTKALQYQRRFMRRYLRKPRDTTIRKFNSRLQELNAYLEQFPLFGNNQKLDDDDLLEVLEFSIPNKWQSQMVLQGFNPSERTITELVEFCERLEFIEQMTPNGSSNGQNGNDHNKGKNFRADPKGSNKNDHKRGAKTSDEASKSDRANKRPRTGKYCPLHDTNTHDMSECKTMLNQAKKMRDSYSNRGPGYKKDTSADKKKEFNAFLENKINKALKKAQTKKSNAGKNDTVTEEELDAFNAIGDFSALNITMSDSDDESTTSIWETSSPFDSELNSYIDTETVKQECYSLGQRNNRKRKRLDNENDSTNVHPLRPVTFGRLRVNATTNKKKLELRTMRILCDSGASATIVDSNFVKKLKQKEIKNTSWSTPAGAFETKYKANIKFTLPEFHAKKLITWDTYITDQPMNYDLIIGRDLMKELGLIIDFKNESIIWDDVKVSMKTANAQPPKEFYNTGKPITPNKIKEILSAKYAPANLAEEVKSFDHLSSSEQADLLTLLTKYESLFDGTLGKWTGEEHEIHLKEGATPYHARPYPIPQAYEIISRRSRTARTRRRP